jgi:hypothetical protein
MGCVLCARTGADEPLGPGSHQNAALVRRRRQPRLATASAGRRTWIPRGARVGGAGSAATGAP